MNRAARHRAPRTNTALEHDPEKHALGLDPMGAKRFSEKLMRNQESKAG
jgi:hypothetical protein